MKIKQILPVAVPILLVTAAILVYVKVSSNNANVCTVDGSNTERHCSETVFRNATTTPQLFTFKELGISLNILPQWRVELQTVENLQSSQTTEYVWTVKKNDGTGKLVLDSMQYASGSASACMAADMSPATVMTFSETENPTLKYVIYKTNINGKDVHVPLIVRADEKSFYSSKSSANPVSIVSPGDYYVCTGGFTLPGSNLHLGDFPRPFTGEWRQSISALQNDSTGANWLPLPADSPALSDISTMLKSIR